MKNNPKFQKGQTVFVASDIQIEGFLFFSEPLALVIEMVGVQKIHFPEPLYPVYHNRVFVTFKQCANYCEKVNRAKIRSCKKAIEIIRDKNRELQLKGETK